MDRFDAEDAEEFRDLMERIRNGKHVEYKVITVIVLIQCIELVVEYCSYAQVRHPAHKQEIVRFTRYLEDDFTLDNLSREQLIAMCKYMGINPYGTDAFLRFQVRELVLSLERNKN